MSVEGDICEGVKHVSVMLVTCDTLMTISWKLGVNS